MLLRRGMRSFPCAQATFAGLSIADGALLTTDAGDPRRPLTQTSESVCGCIDYRDVLPRSLCGDAVLLKVRHGVVLRTIFAIRVCRVEE